MLQNVIYVLHAFRCRRKNEISKYHFDHYVKVGVRVISLQVAICRCMRAWLTDPSIMCRRKLTHIMTQHPYTHTYKMDVTMAAERTFTIEFIIFLYDRCLRLKFFLFLQERRSRCSIA